MALAYIAKPIAYDRLVQLLDITELGTPAFKIKELEQLGVAVLYKQGTLAELQTHLENNRPCIAFVKTQELPYWDEETGHALLVVGLVAPPTGTAGRT